MKVNLGKLAFTAEDFDGAITDTELENLPFHSGHKTVRSQTDVFAEFVNRTLEKRLAKAPRVSGPGRPKAYCDNDMLQFYTWCEVKNAEIDTHTARLVCIEPIPNCKHSDGSECTHSGSSEETEGQ